MRARAKHLERRDVSRMVALRLLAHARGRSANGREEQSAPGVAHAAEGEKG